MTRRSQPGRDLGKGILGRRNKWGTDSKARTTLMCWRNEERSDRDSVRKKMGGMR